MGAFIPIDLTSFNNTPANQTPFSSIQDAIMKARQFELQKEKMRAEILQSQAQTKNLADDNIRSDEYLKIQQGNASRAKSTQDVTDLNTLYDAAAKDPAHAAQIGQTMGLKLKPQAQPNAVDEILAGPQVQGTGGAGLPQDIFGPTGGAAHPDDYGNMMPPSAPQMEMGPRPEAASQLAAQGRVAAAAPSSKMQFEGPGGRVIDIDPEAAAGVHQQDFSEDLEKRTAASGARAVAQAQAAEAKRTFDAEQAAKYKNQGMTVDDRKDIARIGANSRVAAAGISASPELKAAGANRSDLGMLERAKTNAERSVNWKGLIGADASLQKAMAGINSGNSVGEKEAQVAFARFMREAMPTEGEMHLVYGNLGGLAQKIPGLIEQMERGGLAPGQLKIVKDAINHSHATWAARRDQTLKSLGTTFGPGSGFEHAAPQINTWLRAKGQMTGIELPDLYPDAQGGIVLGSSERPEAAAARLAGTPKRAPTDKGRAAKLQNAGAVSWAKSNENSPDPDTREKALKMKARLEAMGAW